VDAFWIIDAHREQEGRTKSKRGIISSALVEKALQIAFDAHKEQTDAAGRPYILRTIHTAEQVQGDYPVCAALLRDVVKSGGITLEKLAAEGFPDVVIEVVKILTRDPAVPYLEHVQRVKDSANAMAVNIKLLDVLFDSDLSKYKDADDWVIGWYEQQMQAMAILESDNRKDWHDEEMQYIYTAVTSRAIDIRMNAPSIGGRLSNLEVRPFVFCGIECGSIEGVLQSFKFRNPIEQYVTCKLHGIKAKKEGRKQDWRSSQTLYWMGKEFPRMSQAYQHLLDMLYQTAFEQDRSFREDLARSKGYKLLHSVGYNNPAETILTTDEFLSRLERLRDSLTI